MTPQETLVELLARLVVSGGTVAINEYELGQWPADAVTALKAQGLLVKIRAATNTTCPGCEQHCFMPVHVLPGIKPVAAFVVCDKRDDTNRVMLPAVTLNQWQCTVKAVCIFLAAALEVRGEVKQQAVAGLWTIGMVTGKKRSQVLCLRMEGELALVAGGNSLPLLPILEYIVGQYGVNAKLVQQLVDNSSTGDPRYTPSVARREIGKQKTEARYEQWRKAYKVLLAERPGESDPWYSKQIAKQFGNKHSSETIRKKMK